LVRDDCTLRAVVAFGVCGQDVGEFFRENWEKRPRVFRNAFTDSFFADRLSFPRLLDLVQRLAGEDDALDFGLDINAARYRDGVRETPNREVRGRRGLGWVVS
jgi:hypothetical protein